MLRTVVVSELDRRRAEALRRWLAGDVVDAIAHDLKVSAATIYEWRYRLHWPTRKPVPRRLSCYRYLRSDWYLLRPQRVAMAAKLWREHVPKIDIANLCEVGLSTLAVWRAREGWVERRGGRRPLDREALLARRINHDRTALDRMAKVRYERHNGRPFPKPVLPAWRCCEQRVAGSVCPRCRRRHPLIA